MTSKAKKGFTLIEILIAIALIALLLVLTTPFTIDFYRVQVLEGQTDGLANNLKVAQSHAQSGKNNSAWGIRFFANRYVLFMGNSYDEVGRNRTHDKTFQITSGVQIEGVTEIVFERGTGKLLIVN